MNEEEYIKNRLEDQIKWYSEKSGSCKNYFKRMRTVEIIAAAIIPFLAGFGQSWPGSQVAIGCLGVLIAVLAAISTLNKFQENWISYRAMGEALKREKYLFRMKTAPYDGDNAINRLVLKVESLIASENSHWQTYFRKGETEE